MAAPIPPAAVMQTGPPMQPPELPTLSAMPQGPGTAPPTPGQVGSLPELFFGIEQQLKLVAKAVPGEAVAELDHISQLLRAVLVKVLQSGAALGSDVPTLAPEAQNMAVTSPAGPARTDTV